MGVGVNEPQLSHLDKSGRATMVDVSDKASTLRTATAVAQFICAARTLQLVRDEKTPKGAVVPTAELAGIMAAKQTSNLIPLCHPLALTKVTVKIELSDELPGFNIRCEVRTKGPTGVEMEALTGVSVAALTLFDMLKAVDKSMSITATRVEAKTGGKSGNAYGHV
jgi:cyclic pyranopterin phosphate synthase